MSWKDGRALAGWPARLAICVAVLLGSAGAAWAQEIEPNEFVPAPDGTNANLLYFLYGRQGSFNTPSGTNVPNSTANAYIGVERFVHFNYIFDHPAGVQIVQNIGAISNPEIGGQSLSTASGFSNVNLSAFVWPYANFERRQYLLVAAFLYPPSGTYRKNEALNFGPQYQPNGQYNWTGDVQVGWNQGVDEHFSYDLGFDARMFGDTTGPLVPGSNIPISVLTHHDSDYRIQLWLNWAWNRALTTAIGYQGFFGGLSHFNTPFTGTVDTGKSFEQRLRGSINMFWSPRFQTVLEVNGDVARTGGYRQTIGTTLRLLYLF